MSYRIDGKDIVISGFEKGIAETPYSGIADMRNVEIISIPGEASVQFSEIAATAPPVKTAVSFTAQNSGDTITPSGGTSGFYEGVAITLVTNSAGGITTGVVYYVRNISGGTTFQVSLSLTGAVINISSDGSGTFTTYQYGNQRGLSAVGAPNAYIVDRVLTNGIANGIYLTDQSNYLWYISQTAAGSLPANSLIFMGNIGAGAAASNTSRTGVVIWKTYIILFYADGADIAKLSTLFSNGPAAIWSYAWLSASCNANINSRIGAIAAQDDAVYFTSSAGVGSILENAGTTFAPGTPATYTQNVAALSIPTTDRSTCLAELGTTLLVGGKLSFVYPWDRVSTSYNYPIIVPDAECVNIIGTNQNAFVFSGNRGRIYLTNGSSIDLFKKMPDYLSGLVNPYFRWWDASYNRNQLYFSLLGESNADSNLTTMAGAWAIDMNTDALRLINKITNSGYSGFVKMVVEAPFDSYADLPAGTSLLLGWFVSPTYGVDVSSGDPYTNYESYIDTDMIPVGTYLDPQTDAQIEWKTSAPIVSGEGVKISYRQNISASFTQIDESTTAGLISDVFTANFEKSQWVQFRIELKSTASTPSYTRLTEIRVRNFKQ